MTVLIAGGDSVTYGSELASQEHTWANLLANRKGWNICNTAQPGYSNSAIRRNVMNAINEYKDLDLYVAVMWSFPNRYEFRFAYDTGHKETPWYSINPWTPKNYIQQTHKHNADSKGITEFANNYVKNVAIEPYWEIYNSWCEIVMLQNYLVKHNIKYAFMTVDYTIFKPNTVLDKTLKTLIADIDMSKVIDQEGMYTWAKRTKQEFYKTHPKESAHIEWINMLYNRIV